MKVNPLKVSAKWKLALILWVKTLKVTTAYQGRAYLDTECHYCLPSESTLISKVETLEVTSDHCQRPFLDSC
jgi:hypothetical protein